jgi:hypothetical protein
MQHARPLRLEHEFPDHDVSRSRDEAECIRPFDCRNHRAAARGAIDRQFRQDPAAFRGDRREHVEDPLDVGHACNADVVR